MLKHTFLIGLFLAICSCSNNKVEYAEYSSLPDGWEKDRAVSFNFKAPDTVNTYNVFINLRNDERFPFSNLYLIVNMEFPGGRVITDTLEYEMAKPDGAWLGQGFTDLKESKLWYKEAVRFPDTGTYRMDIFHAMRKNGNVDGVRSLEGVTDVGISIEN